MSLLQGFLFDSRRSLRRALLIAVALPVALMAIGSVVLAGVYYSSSRAKPPTSGLDPSISVSAFTPGIVQVADCIRTGPTCTQYVQAKEYMVKATPAEGLVYTPRKPSDPGQPEGDGRRLRLTRDTPDTEWKAWADAVTLDGRANPSTVRETGVTVRDKTTGVFLLAERTPAYTGTVSFALQQSGVLVTSITYVKG